MIEDREESDDRPKCISCYNRFVPSELNDTVLCDRCWDQWKRDVERRESESRESESRESESCWDFVELEVPEPVPQNLCHCVQLREIRLTPEEDAELCTGLHHLPGSRGPFRRPEAPSKGFWLSKVGSWLRETWRNAQVAFRWPF